MPETNVDAIRHALTVAATYGFAEVQIEMGESSFEAKLGASRKRTTVPQTAQELSTIAAQIDGVREIVAPLVGYYQPAEPPLEVGKEVREGDIVAVISALGLANDLESAVTGAVVEVLVKPGDSVEYGQVLARVEANS